MSIRYNTIQITYGDVTRSHTKVWVGGSSSYYDVDNYAVCALEQTAEVLYLFRDLIGVDWQSYRRMKLPFSIYEDCVATLELPPKVWTFHVQTIGHGDFDISIDNSNLNNIAYYTFTPSYIKKHLQAEIGIPYECFNICNEEGKSCDVCIRGYKENMPLFAVIQDWKEKVEEEGHEIIHYDGNIKEGTLMRYDYISSIGNYTIVQFLDLEGQVKVNKRTPKMVALEIAGVLGRRRKVDNAPFGEAVLAVGSMAINSIEGIDWNKTYAILNIN